MLHPKTRKLMDAITAILNAPKGQELQTRLDLGFRTMSVDRTDRMALLMLDELRHRLNELPEEEHPRMARVLVALGWWSAQLMAAAADSYATSPGADEIFAAMEALLRDPAVVPDVTITVGGRSWPVSRTDQLALQTFSALNEYEDASADEVAEAIINLNWWYMETTTAEQENKRMKLETNQALVN